MAELCDNAKPGQLWTTNSIGELKTIEDKNLCLTNFQGQKIFKMALCELVPNQVFVFDMFYQSLLWLKNKGQIAKYGMRAITILSEPKTNAPSTVYVKKRKGKPLQKWDFQYISS